MKYSIIIPVLNQEKLTRACIESVKKYTDDYEIILIDNGSEKPFESECYTIRNEENLGFPKAINQGIKEASGDIIVLLNNDTVVSFGWLERLTSHFANYDIVGPLTNSISGPQMLMAGEIVPPEGINELSNDIYKANFGRSTPFHRCVFYCVAIKKAVFDKIGLLDEQFSPGNCEDDDFCLRAIDAGFKIGIAEDCFIYHAGSATFKKDTPTHKKLVLANSEKLMAKYPKEKYDELVRKNLLNCSGIDTGVERKLALCMVVKNEGLGLERAILSVKDYVSEIVLLVDNSSSDNTLEIAKKYATTLKTFDWFDDFAGARNLCHEGVKADWILFLDGHEYVTSLTNLKQKLNSPADGLLCTVELESGAQIRNPRIYRNGLKFAGKVHEMQNCKTLSVFTDFVVVHGRTGGQSDDAIKIRDAQRNDQLSRIMGEQLKDNPADARASFHLALHAQSLGDFKKALKLQKQYFKYGIAKGERWYVYFNRGLCHFALGNYLRALWTCSDAEKECPAKWEIAKLRGLIYFKMQDYTRAIKYFVDCFDENTGDVSYKPWARDNAGVWNLIGECYFNLNKMDLAKDSFKQAWKLETEGKLKKFYYDRMAVIVKMI